MVKINLVPERVRSAETLKIVIALGSLSLVLPVLFWAWQYGQVKSELSLVEDKILKVTMELNSPQLKNVVLEVEQFEADRQNLEIKRSVVDVLRKRQSGMVRFFDVLPDLVPKRAWLTSMDTQTLSGKLKIQVEGYAKAPEVVAEFYSALQAHPVIIDAELVDAPRMVMQGPAEVVGFKIRFSRGGFRMSKKHWIVVGIFGVLFGVIAYLGWFLLVQPVRADIDTKQNEYEEAKKKLEVAQAKASQKEKFQAMAENVRRDLALVASRVDSTLPITDLYYIFSSLGNRLALPKYEFTDKPREAVKETALPGMDRIWLKVKFQTSFNEVGQFLNSVVSMDRLMAMDTFKLKSSSEVNRPPLDCEMELSLFLESVKGTVAK